MSYPFTLSFYVGRVRESVEDIEVESQKISVVAHPEGEKPSKEIWSSYDSFGLGIARFGVGARTGNWTPQFVLREFEMYRWDLAPERRRLIDYLDSLTHEAEEYYIFYLRDTQIRQISTVLLDILKKRIGHTLLHKAITLNLSEYSSLNWILVLGRRQPTGSGSAARLPFKKHISIWNERPNRSDMDKNKSHPTRENIEFAILGQSLSTNCAGVRLVF